MNRPMATHRRKPGNNPFAGRRVVKKAERTVETKKEPDRFRILIAVNRPRYRSRAERAVDIPGWEVRSLLNKEDPIGIMNQKPPHIFILSADFGRNKTLGFLKAAQKFRAPDMKIIALFEDEEEMATAEGLYDAAFFPPWKTIELRAVAAEQCAEITGRAPILPVRPGEEDSE